MASGTIAPDGARAQQRDQGEDAGGKDRKPDGQDPQDAEHRQRDDGGDERRAPVRHAPKRSVCRQQRTSRKPDQDPGQRLITLLTHEPDVEDRHPGGHYRGSQGKRLNGAPHACIHDSMIHHPGRGPSDAVTLSASSWTITGPAPRTARKYSNVPEPPPSSAATSTPNYPG